MRFEVLGPLRACCGGAELRLGEPQQQELLALLLAARGRPVSTERLIEEIWSGEPPPSARHLVHVYVARLRDVLDDRERIRRDGSGYVLSVAPDEVDAIELEAAVEIAREERDRDPALAANRLRAATDAWRGRPFGDLADESETLRAEARRLEELYLSAVEALVDAELQLGRHAQLTGMLDRLVTENPYRERFWGQRMLALYRSGRQAEALQAYEELRRTLATDLGIAPGSDVRALERGILFQDPDLLWEPPSPPSNLPIPTSSFIGRRWEVAEVAKLLDTSRLVTLTGPGGIGKTRLALEAAGELLLRFPDGVWWVDLASVRDPDLVPTTVAKTLGVAPQPHTPLAESIVRALVRRSALLLLDNCEHLAPTVGVLVDAVLGKTRRVRVLATSRSPLHASGEALWTVPPLAMPSTATNDPTTIALSDAVRLFVERAAALDTGFRLDAGNAAHVVDVCRRLDGLALAIEMAARRVRVLAPAQIADALSDRFALLGTAELGSRHRTLEAALDWSYDVLPPEHRRTFDRLSVLADRFDLDAASAVTGCDRAATLDAIASLVDASMLDVVRTDAATSRYRVLETMREYGLRRLGSGPDEAAARTAHADHFLGLVEQAAEHIGTRAFVTTSEILGNVSPDLRRALDWSLRHDGRSRVLGLGRTLFHFWFQTGDGREAGVWGRRMLDGADHEPSGLRGFAHLLVAFSSNLAGDADTARTESALAVELLRGSRDRVGLATALFGRANVALLTGDVDAAGTLARDAVALADELGDRWIRAGAQGVLSFVGLARGSLDDARASAEEALSLYRDLGDVTGQVVMCPLDAIAVRQGDLDRAESFLHETAAISAATPWGASTLVRLADVLLARGEADAAEPLARRGAIRALDAGMEIWFREALGALARVHADQGDAEAAGVLLGASQRNALGLEVDPATAASVEERCRDALGDESFRAARERGLAMDHEQLIELVGDLAGS